MQITDAQVMQARTLVKRAQANGDVPNPATVAIANRDTETLAKIAQRLEIAKINSKPRRVRKGAK